MYRKNTYNLIDPPAIITVMLIQLLFSDPISFAIIASGLITSITIHEFSHAWMADHLGDPTPRYQGRVSLDPRAHLDPLGTLAILLVNFGWGKPVMFDPYNLKDPVKDSALIALAGPVSNILLATLLSLLVKFTPLGAFAVIIEAVIFINVMLAIFNLIPIHPLDGSKILLPLLPRVTAIEYEEFMHRYGTFLLIAMIFPWGGGRSPASLLISPIIQFIIGILL